MPYATIMFQDVTRRTLLKGDDEIELRYPCSDTVTCSHYTVILPRGKYKLEAYGASGGTETNATTLRDNDRNCIDQEIVKLYRGNTVCNPINSPGAGGYISGIINLNKITTFFIHIGGKGEYVKSINPKGGYNGGGNGYRHNMGSAGGGGSTDFRVEKNDYWHRILVGGGGGGTDDNIVNDGGMNDGSGGAGGYPNGQTFFTNNILNGSYGGTQNFGYSFFQGESATFQNYGSTD